MTERLYYQDSYLTRFEARVMAGGMEAVLDRTAFYPSSGGQPNDLGRLGGAVVRDVMEDETGRVVHVLDRALEAGSMVAGEVDWDRRFDHMQQHSGQHLLSAVIHDMNGWTTLSFHLGAEVSTIDLDVESIPAEQLERIEAEANRRITANAPVTVAFEDAERVQGLRKASERGGTLRVVSIEGLDRSACGGTHVRATGEIGCLLVRKQEKVRGSVRVEFVCGGRAVARAREDYRLLTRVARSFSAGLEEAPELVANLIEQAKESEKAKRKLAMELATLRGRELYASTAVDEEGCRVVLERVAALDEEVRALAQSFTARAGARFVAVCKSPPSVLYAVSEGVAPAAGERLKQLLALHGGRGGGAARMAQGSLPDGDSAERVAEELAARRAAR
jgi:alanyl-tRNA synthetase